MIGHGRRRSQQNWEPGSLVKVGFMTLVVLQKVPSPGDYKPDQYLLRHSSGAEYAFIPHNGLHKLDNTDASAMRRGEPIAV